jgi:hypothetical protein
MNARQIVFPFGARRARPPKDSNRDLIGRSYQENEYTTVTVIGVCPGDVTRVVFRRDPDGGTYSMFGWLMRFALMDSDSREKKRRRAA